MQCVSLSLHISNIVRRAESGRFMLRPLFGAVSRLLALQCTLLTAGLLMFARTFPYSRMFSGSLLSAKLRYKCTSLAILSFCDLALTKIFSLFIYFYPSTVSSQSGYRHIAPAAAWRAAVLGVSKSQTRLSNWTELNWCCPNVPGTCSLSCCLLCLEL